MWVLAVIAIMSGDMVMLQNPYPDEQSCLVAREKLVATFPASDTNQLMAANCVRAAEEKSI
jgi:hypothetical protein